jgi:hypothetical protein
MRLPCQRRAITGSGDYESRLKVRTTLVGISRSGFQTTMYRHCGPAKQSIGRRTRNNGLLRRFAPLRKRFAFVAGNDVVFRYASAFPRRNAPELCMIFRPRKGVGNAGCPMHPQPRVRNKKAHERSHHESTRIHPAFPHAMVLTASFVISPVIGY